MSWLDAQFGRIFDSGTEIELSSGINFSGGLRAGLNPVTKTVEVVVADGGVGADEAGPAANGAAIGLVLSVAFDGSTRDVPLFTSAPYGFRILDAWTKVSDTAGGSCRWRSESGGNGSELTASMSCASTGTVRESTTSSPAVALGTGCHLRLSALGIEGEAFLLVAKT